MIEIRIPAQTIFESGSKNVNMEPSTVFDFFFNMTKFEDWKGTEKSINSTLDSDIVKSPKRTS